MAQSQTFVRRWLFIFVAVALIAIDQFIKELAINTLELGVSYPVVGELLSWRLVYNDSAAFGLGFGYTWILAITSSIATLVTIWYARKITTLSWSIMAGVFLAGVVGNLVDRLARDPGFGVGHVVDYIQIPFNFPVFNLADMLIVTMVSLSVLRIFRGENLGGIEPVKK